MAVTPSSNPELEQYKAEVRRKIAQLAPIFARASVGDFAEAHIIPEQEDEFSELYAGVEVMLGVIRQQLAALEEEAAKSEAILDSIGEGMIATDPEGVVLVMNTAAESMLGFTRAELIGKPLAEMVHMQTEQGKILTKAERPITLALQTRRRIVTNQYYYVTKTNERFPMATTTTPVIFHGELSGSVVVFRDITHEKQVDRAKDEFVSLASHQLRTPLTIIKWYMSRLLYSATNLPLGAQADMQEVYRTNERMIELVNAILDVSRIELGTLTVEPQDVDLRSVANTVIKELELSLSQRQIQIKLDYGFEIPIIRLDPKLISMMFNNLLSNAIKYTPPGGTITVGLHKENNQMVITVSDTGYGISPADQRRIFQKFFRAETARRIDPDGNGLGLYLVQAVVKLAQGQIKVESREGEGTTFYVILPLSGMPVKLGTTRLTKLHL